ncbi:MAG: tetratricopeptide repeat protein [Candidatus Omnitrophota bacterium]
MVKKKKKTVIKEEALEAKKEPCVVTAGSFFGINPAKRSISGRNRLKIAVLCVLVFLAAFFAYFNTLKADFIWDDEYLILNNSQIKSFTHLQSVFKNYVGYGSENINNFYRPVQEISNMVDYHLWGENPAGFHGTNIALHSLVAVCVFIFLYYLTANSAGAAIAALLWAVHPVHTEAVAYIAGRADSLYSLFMLISLILFVRFTHKARSGKNGFGLYFFSLTAFVLALLSKEIVILLPLFILIYLLYFVKDTEDKAVFSKLKWTWVPYAGISLAYAFLRKTVLSFSDIAPPSAFTQIPMVNRLLTFFRVIGVYLRLMIFPSDLHMERSISITKSLMDPASILALFMVAVIGWIAVKTYKRNRLVSFCIAWFFANLLPVSNIVPINSFLAEHWIYMASIGPFLLIGMALAGIWEKYCRTKMSYRIVFSAVLISVFGISFYGTVSRNSDWKDEISFFTSTLKYHPRNARLYLNLGNTYYEKKDITKAIEQYQKAININPGYSVAYGNIGSAYLNLKKPAEAEKYLRKAIALKDNYPIAHYNLGIIYYDKKNYSEAVKELKISVEQLPQLYQAWNMLARTYLKLGDNAGARSAFERSLKIFPGQEPIERALKSL